MWASAAERSRQELATHWVISRDPSYSSLAIHTSHLTRLIRVPGRWRPSWLRGLPVARVRPRALHRDMESPWIAPYGLGPCLSVRGPSPRRLASTTRGACCAACEREGKLAQRTVKWSLCRPTVCYDPRELRRVRTFSSRCSTGNHLILQSTITRQVTRRYSFYYCRLQQWRQKYPISSYELRL